MLRYFIFALFIVSLDASADSGRSLRCYFTEPFIEMSVSAAIEGTSWNSVGSSVVIEERSNGQKVMGSVYSIERVEEGLQLKIASGRFDAFELMVDLQKNGSDGMSDHVYRYEGILTVADSHLTVMGGCDEVQY